MDDRVADYGHLIVDECHHLPAHSFERLPNVVLPSDPGWKRDYSGSVRRLVRDGVDMPLASLFVHAARPVPPDADGADRARSANEAFLYRRLETRAPAKGRFDVHVSLPIAFDGLARLRLRPPSMLGGEAPPR